mgnify:CR=1 FL=1
MGGCRTFQNRSGTPAHPKIAKTVPTRKRLFFTVLFFLKKLKVHIGCFRTPPKRPPSNFLHPPKPATHKKWSFLLVFAELANSPKPSKHP